MDGPLTFSQVFLAVMLGNGVMMFFAYLVVKGHLYEKRTGEEPPSRYLWGVLAVSAIWLVTGLAARG